MRRITQPTTIMGRTTQAHRYVQFATHLVHEPQLVQHGVQHQRVQQGQLPAAIARRERQVAGTQPAGGEERGAAS